MRHFRGSDGLVATGNLYPWLNIDIGGAGGLVSSGRCNHVLPTCNNSSVNSRIFTLRALNLRLLCARIYLQLQQLQPQPQLPLQMPPPTLLSLLPMSPLLLPLPMLPPTQLPTDAAAAADAPLLTLPSLSPLPPTPMLPLPPKLPLLPMPTQLPSLPTPPSPPMQLRQPLPPMLPKRCAAAARSAAVALPDAQTCNGTERCREAAGGEAAQRREKR